MRVRAGSPEFREWAQHRADFLNLFMRDRRTQLTALKQKTFVAEIWAVMAHDYCGKTGTRPPLHQVSRHTTAWEYGSKGGWTIEPDEAVSYGPHRMQVIYFWRAKSDQPTPLLVYIHGGGWQGGDRSVVRSILKPALDARISVASVEYRTLKDSTAEGLEMQKCELPARS